MEVLQEAVQKRMEDIVRKQGGAEELERRAAYCESVSFMLKIKVKYRDHSLVISQLNICSLVWIHISFGDSNHNSFFSLSTVALVQ